MLLHPVQQMNIPENGRYVFADISSLLDGNKNLDGPSIFHWTSAISSASETLDTASPSLESSELLTSCGICVSPFSCVECIRLIAVLLFVNFLDALGVYV